jgi:hypothetical protein
VDSSFTFQVAIYFKFRNHDNYYGKLNTWDIAVSIKECCAGVSYGLQEFCQTLIQCHTTWFVLPTNAMTQHHNHCNHPTIIIAIMAIYYIGYSYFCALEADCQS